MLREGGSDRRPAAAMGKNGVPIQSSDGTESAIERKLKTNATTSVFKCVILLLPSRMRSANAASTAAGPKVRKGAAGLEVTLVHLSVSGQ